MDSRSSHEGRSKKRRELRRFCTLCNEPCPDAQHYATNFHKYMKRVKQMQYSYTKNLKTLDEKIKAAENKEPLIGLEYIHQYSADKRGIIPYVCTLCDAIYKINTIFFHIAGIKHRTMYLGKNYSVMGIDCNFKTKCQNDYRKLLSAAEIVEKNQGRKKINISNTFFNAKKNGGLLYDSDSGDEGLSLSEDEQDNPDSAPVNYAAGDDNRYQSHRDNIPFQRNCMNTPPLPDVCRGAPSSYHDDRRVPELLEFRNDMNPPLRNHGDSGFPHDGYGNTREGNDGQSMEFSYRQRGPDRTSFPSDRNPSSQTHRDGMGFHYDDRKGLNLQGCPGHTDNQVRNNDRDFAFRRDQTTRPLGSNHDPHGDLDMPSTRLPGIPKHIEKQVRGKDNGFAFQHDQSTRSLGRPQGDLDIPPMGPLRQPDVSRQNMSQGYPPDFLGDHNLGSGMPRDGMYDDRRGPVFQDVSRHTDHQTRNSDRDYAFRHNLNARSIGNPHGDVDISPVGPLHERVDRDGIKGQNRTPSHHPDHQNLSSRMHRDGMFPNNDRQKPTLHVSPRNTDNPIRNNEHDFAFSRDQSGRPVDRGDPKSQNRTQNHPPGGFGDYGSQSQMHRRGTGLGHYDDKPRPELQGGPRQTGSQVKENKDLSSKDGQSRRPLGGPLNDDLKAQSRTCRPDDGMAFQFHDRPGPTLQGDPGHTDNRARNDSRSFANRRAQLPGSSPCDLDMGPLHQQIDRNDIQGQKRGYAPGFSGALDLSCRSHKDEMGFQHDKRHGPTLQGGPRLPAFHDHDFAFRHDQSSRSRDNPHGGLDMPGPLHQQVDPRDMKGQKKTQSHAPGFPGNLDVQYQTQRGTTAFQYDDMQDAMPPSGRGYRQGDRLGFEERASAQNSHPGFSGNLNLRSPRQGGGAGSTFQELKAVYESRLGQGNSTMDDQGATYDSDMEVRSMDLSDCDPDEFLCNAELFEFLKTFQVRSYEDEQFALKVRDYFTSSTIRYQNRREEALKKRIAEEKEKLEEEKKAFLKIQKSKIRRLTTTSKKKKAPGPSSSSNALFPITILNNAAQAINSALLMSIMIQPDHLPGPDMQNSPSFPDQNKLIDAQMSHPMPTMDSLPGPQGQWEQGSLQPPSEIGQDLFPSRGHSDRNLPSRFTKHL